MPTRAWRGNVAAVHPALHADTADGPSLWRLQLDRTAHGHEPG